MDILQQTNQERRINEIEVAQQHLDQIQKALGEFSLLSLQEEGAEAMVNRGKSLIEEISKH